VFDAVDDTLTIETLQGFEFEGLEAYPRVLEPLLFYILYRANAAIRADESRSRLKVFVCDEAWRFAQDPTVTAYLVEALKTWRKHNAVLLLATQSDQDLGDEGLLRAVLDNCPTQVFLANPGLDLAHAQDRFHLTLREAQWIRELRPREQLLLKRPDHTTVLSMRVDDASYACYATDRRPRAGQKEIPR
jgi:type IV secretion system protein VirB4